MRKPLVAGNWKMNGSIETVKVITKAFAKVESDGIEVVVCPPSAYLSALHAANQPKRVVVGAQDVSAYSAFGAYTGQVSAPMLVDLGCRYVIVGHSERRTLCHEDDETVAKKALAAVNAGVTPIICVGESLAEYKAGNSINIVLGQVEVVLNALGVSGMQKAVLAYEPVWAIGTGLSASPQEANAVHAAIRAFLAKTDNHLADNIRILYGGSVKPENAGDLFQEPDIDGGLIGGASLNAGAFLTICEAAKKAKHASIS